MQAILDIQDTQTSSDSATLLCREQARLHRTTHKARYFDTLGIGCAHAGGQRPWQHGFQGVKLPLQPVAD